MERYLKYNSYINFLNDNNITALARSYNILEPSSTLRKILSSVVTDNDFISFSKFQLHSLFSEIIFNEYKGEPTLKAKLVEMFIKQNITAAFEIKINNSRVDFLTINGETKSFEIKSELDNLRKLSKQVSDYEKVFEFNYIVIDEKHYSNAENIIPANYGIMILRNGKLTEDRKAKKNKFLNAEMQLKLFTKKELIKWFKETEPNVETILQNFSASKINLRLKEMLKKRYEGKWNFLVQNKKNILPIDYQFFFHHNIQPNIIYGQC